MGIRNEDRRRSGGRELPHGSARAGDREVSRRESGTEVVSRRDEHVVASMHPRAHGVVVALPRHVQNRRSVFAERLDGEFVQRLGACEPAEDREHRRFRREPEERPPLHLPGAEVRRRNRPADDAVLPTFAAGDRIGEKDAPRERRGETVRETEMRVGLRQRSWDPPQARGQHHRSGDVASTAEHDVGPPPREDPAARERRANGLRERSYEPEPDTPRKSRDRERVELEARLRNELRLDAVGRPGERHCHSARAKCFRDCESGPDVTGRPSCRYHAPKPGRPFH